MESITVVDAIILIAFLPALIGGLRSGLVRQLSALIALIAGVWIGWHFSNGVATLLRNLFKWEGQLVQIVAFLLLLFGVIFLVNLIGRTIASLLKFLLLGWVDRILGVLFAIIKYAFLFSIIIYVLTVIDNNFPFLPEESLSKSIFYTPLKEFAPLLSPYLKKINFL